MSVLIIAEHDNALLKGVTYHAITAGICIGGEVHVLVAGSNARTVADQAARISGVCAVLLAEGPFLADGLAENVCEQVLKIANGYSHILFAATASGKNIAPRVAARLNVAQISEIIGIDSPDTFQRPIYAGNVIATVQSLDPIKVITVRTTAFNAATENGYAATAVQDIAAVATTGKSTLNRRQLTLTDRPELAGARIVVSGGRGLGSAENFKMLNPLADKLNAALGASRAAVDAGYAPNDWQVGQTGKVVAPDLYLAIGISGAIQHLAGMKDAKVIVAVNNDAEAPIFGVTDYGLEADLFLAIPELVSQL